MIEPITVMPDTSGFQKVKGWENILLNLESNEQKNENSQIPRENN
jgi:hypothetical protein